MKRKQKEPGCLGKLVSGALTSGIIIVLGGVGYFSYEVTKVADKPRLTLTETIDGYQVIERENGRQRRIFYHNSVKDKEILVLESQEVELGYTDIGCDGSVDIIDYSISQIISEQYKREEIQGSDKLKYAFARADTEFQKAKEEMYRVEK